MLSLEKKGLQKFSALYLVDLLIIIVIYHGKDQLFITPAWYHLI